MSVQLRWNDNGTGNPKKFGEKSVPEQLFTTRAWTCSLGRLFMKAIRTVPLLNINYADLQFFCLSASQSGRHNRRVHRRENFKLEIISYLYWLHDSSFLTCLSGYVSVSNHENYGKHVYEIRCGRLTVNPYVGLTGLILRTAPTQMSFYALVTAVCLLTERHGRVVYTPASYSGGPGFKSRPRDRLSCPGFFMVFLGPSRRLMV
jgi:hypothetical protein